MTEQDTNQEAFSETNLSPGVENIAGDLTASLTQPMTEDIAGSLAASLTQPMTEVTAGGLAASLTQPMTEVTAGGLAASLTQPMTEDTAGSLLGSITRPAVEELDGVAAASIVQPSIEYPLESVTVSEALRSGEKDFGGIDRNKNPAGTSIDWQIERTIWQLHAHFAVVRTTAFLENHKENLNRGMLLKISEEIAVFISVFGLTGSEKMAAYLCGMVISLHTYANSLQSENEN